MSGKGAEGLGSPLTLLKVTETIPCWSCAQFSALYEARAG